MAKVKSRKKIKPVSPLIIAAEETLTTEARQHAKFVPSWFNERGCDGGVLDNVRMEKLACVRPLEGLARKHHKAKTAFLSPDLLMAANAYMADLQGCRAQSSHAVRDVIDVSTDAEAGFLYRLEAQQKLARIQNRMPGRLKHVLDTILVNRPDHTLMAIWPNRRDRDIAKEQIREGLTWLAREYGLS